MPTDDPTIRELAASVDRHADALKAMAEEWSAYRKDHSIEHKEVDRQLGRALQSLESGNKRFESQENSIKTLREETRPTHPRVWAALAITFSLGIGSSIAGISAAFAHKVDRAEHDASIAELNRKHDALNAELGQKIDVVSTKLTELSTEVRISNRQERQ